MPPIGPTLPSASIVPVPAIDRAAGQVVVADQVEDAEGQHQPGRRAADVLHLDVDVERRDGCSQDRDAEQRPLALLAASGW